MATQSSPAPQTMKKIPTKKVKAKVIRFSKHKGYGFCVSDNKHLLGDILIHYSAVEGEEKTLKKNEMIEVEVCETPFGLKAKKVIRKEDVKKVKPDIAPSL